MKQNSGLSMERIEHLLKQPEGQKLAAILSKTDPQLFQQAARSMASENNTATAELLGSFLRDNQLQSLLARLKENAHG